MVSLDVMFEKRIYLKKKRQEKNLTHTALESISLPSALLTQSPTPHHNNHHNNVTHSALFHHHLLLSDTFLSAPDSGKDL